MNIPIDEIKAGKKISGFLRHYGKLDKDGSTTIPNLLHYLRSCKGLEEITESHVLNIAKKDTKERYFVDGDRICAFQGHSKSMGVHIRAHIPIQSESHLRRLLTERGSDPLPRPVHRTTPEALKRILLDGKLRSGKRMHVHFACLKVLARDRSVSVYLDVDKAIRAGLVLLFAPNGVLLVPDEVPLTVVEIDLGGIRLGG